MEVGQAVAERPKGNRKMTKTRQVPSAALTCQKTTTTTTGLHAQVNKLAV